jgi:hypothetical protein
VERAVAAHAPFTDSLTSCQRRPILYVTHPRCANQGTERVFVCVEGAPLSLNGRGRLPHIWLAAMLVHVVVGCGYRGSPGTRRLGDDPAGSRHAPNSRFSDRHDSFGSERGRRRRSAAAGPGGTDLQRSIHPGNQLATASPGEGRSWGPNVHCGVAYLLWSLVQDMGMGIGLVLTRFPVWLMTNWGMMPPRRCSPPTGSPTQGHARRRRFVAAGRRVARRRWATMPSVSRCAQAGARPFVRAAGRTPGTAQVEEPHPSPRRHSPSCLCREERS